MGSALDLPRITTCMADVYMTRPVLTQQTEDDCWVTEMVECVPCNLPPRAYVQSYDITVTRSHCHRYDIGARIGEKHICRG